MVRDLMDRGVVAAEYWHETANGRVQCDLCPRHCTLSAGQRAFCFVRQARSRPTNDGGTGPTEMVLTSYGLSTGFCIDPIEKKPLNHFYPGTPVLSFGTAGCNLGCTFCQNWDISKAREVERLSSAASPEDIAAAAKRHDCFSVAYTYNDPVIFYEYAVDTAVACREAGIKNVVVTAGYISDAARKGFFAPMDAVNVDLKAFTESFYRKICYGHLDPVLDTLRFLRHETDLWFEVTTLLIPGKNDSDEELRQLCDFFCQEVGPEVPLHFSAFHPDYRMREVPATSAASLRRARVIAKAAGILHVYMGNVHDEEGQSTTCVGCGTTVVGRDWYTLTDWQLDETGACLACGQHLAGRFSGLAGTFGRRRTPLAVL